MKETAIQSYLSGESNRSVDLSSGISATPGKQLAGFLGLVCATVLFTYYAPPLIASGWYILLLAAYFSSRDEGFWLAFFFVTTDGFMGFLGIYTTVVKLPGVPGIEIAQFYILLSAIKAFRQKQGIRFFYGRWLFFLLCYVAFLLLFGILDGLTGEFNVYFRLVKFTLPLLLFYSIPRLFRTIEDYGHLFRFLFLVVCLAFVAELVTLFTGFEPHRYFNPPDEAGLGREAELEVGRNFRVLYNQAITLISLFGAMYFLAYRGRRIFKEGYLHLVIIVAFGIAFLSATRGFILSFGLMIVLFFLFIQRLKPKQVLIFAFLFCGFAVAGIFNKKIQTQIEFSLGRLLTLNSLAGGDISAEGTLIRLSERGPRVMKAWEESPVLGTGFSDRFFEFTDSHVGNQNILLHAGVVGMLLIAGFLFFFVAKMLGTSIHPSSFHFYSRVKPVFVIFLIGWIFIHSTSGQQFAFYGLPHDIFPQAIFLGLAGLTYAESKKNQWDPGN